MGPTSFFSLFFLFLLPLSPTDRLRYSSLFLLSLSLYLLPLSASLSRGTITAIILTHDALADGLRLALHVVVAGAHVSGAIVQEVLVSACESVKEVSKRSCLLIVLLIMCQITSLFHGHGRPVFLIKALNECCRT